MDVTVPAPSVGGRDRDSPVPPSGRSEIHRVSPGDSDSRKERELKLTDQLTARVKARRVVDTLLWVQHYKREQKPGPVDNRLVRVVAAWFSDQWEK